MIPDERLLLKIMSARVATPLVLYADVPALRRRLRTTPPIIARPKPSSGKVWRGSGVKT